MTGAFYDARSYQALDKRLFPLQINCRERFILIGKFICFLVMWSFYSNLYHLSFLWSRCLTLDSISTCLFLFLSFLSILSFSFLFLENYFHSFFLAQAFHFISTLLQREEKITLFILLFAFSLPFQHLFRFLQQFYQLNCFSIFRLSLSIMKNNMDWKFE